MTTRWFVEVSPVDADTLKERYCVEALQWQQALQQARKLRGDRGALSRFAIELLDAGYRATDPSSRLRYTVSTAPRDTPLSGDEPTNGAATAAPVVAAPAPPSSAPVATAPPVIIEPFALVTTAAPPVVAVSPVVAAPPVAAAPPVVVAPPVVTAPAVVVAAVAPAAPAVVVAAPTVVAPAVAPAAPRAAVDRRPEPITEPEPLSFPKATSEFRSEPVPSLPGLDLISLRKEEPTEASPITYREFAFHVAPGLEAKDLERYARAAWEQVRTGIGHLAAGKFVQIALFDHRFAGRPERPPVAVLAWKDWRGDPVVQIRNATSRVGAAVPPVATAPAAQPPAGPPTAVHAPAPPAAAVAAGAPTEPNHAAPIAPAPVVHAAPIAPAPVVHAAPIAPAPIASAPVAPPAQRAPAAGFPAPPSSVKAAAAKAPPPRGQPLRPVQMEVAPRRRGPAEDLIGELFEEMHQLHFMPDIVTGAEYVLNVLARVMPSEGILIHVFDINTRQFVVVRAHGPSSKSVLLRRTPDTFPLFREAFRRARALHFPDITSVEGYTEGRWEILGVEVRTALCGPVKEGGRYLGVIELVNPEGDTTFHDGEVNAIDYICEQFADFVASRPIVLDDDAVIPRT